MYENVVRVETSPRGLKLFQTLAKYEEVSLPATAFSMRNSLTDEESWRDFSPPQFPDNIHIRLPDELSIELEEFEKLCHVYQQYPNTLAEMRATLEDISCITKALNLTTNLQTVWLQGMRSPRNWWNYTPTTQSIVDATTRAATILLFGIFRSRAPIDFMNFDDVAIEDVKSAWLGRTGGDPFCLKGACRPSAFEIPRLMSPLPIPGLQNLTTFGAKIWDCGESA
ncbi:hypothetical protein IWX90DRAFT_112247 [Phyllosticta citrichinensis]|uniref:Uncharacterized protein n=1 Tax=Phyllosticta citrichinensis TaxID=1130410 RepID=A0ABR1Y2X5_9PEZI